MKISEAEVTVRYQETDQMGVVYHANYLVWFEIGRTKFMEDLGFQYHEMEEEGIVVPVVDANIQFKQPVRYGQTAKVKTWLLTYTGVKIVYGYEILDGNGETAVTGTTTHVCVKKETFKPISTRKKFPALHEAYVKATRDE
ncbi:acyl-CoA thioesterase [Salirhabdus sp. Marseille-P4669]|uniref:acyl-CoA thioesterase n=1 Tax=Salirhabdus sp. Marseille-P4669 TaxID=2042310 RepID=UPI000C7A816B|nr:thioesterase family protein [Salirhabdus sp. Marseille-P4669]